MLKMRKRKISYINASHPAASEILACRFLRCLHRVSAGQKDLIFLCIGSDRITGDSLGPLIGRELARHNAGAFHVYGTLDNPVHAMNLKDCLTEIAFDYPSALIVAVDASLGCTRHQHHITVGCGSIQPGAGAGKQLPVVGDLFITGIVSSFENFSHLQLQTLEFAPVLRLADTISRGILMAADSMRKSRPVMGGSFLASQDLTVF